MVKGLKDNGNVLKVVELGISDRVYDAMKQPKFSVEALTRKLKSEGIDITAQSIRKFIKKTKRAQQQLIANDMSAARELKKITMDYGNTLRGILTEVEEVKNEAKDSKDMTTYNQLIGRLMQGVELIAKLTGDLQPKGTTKVDINVIYNEITEDIESRMKNVRKDLYGKNVIDVDAEIAEDDSKVAEALNAGE